jgi:hypothetical protein
MGLLIRKHRELISVVVPGYGDGPPRFGSSTRVGQRPRGWSDAVSATLHPGTPSSPPFPVRRRAQAYSPGQRSTIASGREPRRTPGWPSTALWSVPSLGSHLTACARTPVGAADTDKPRRPRGMLCLRSLWTDRWGSRRVHCWRDRALRRVQTQAQIETRYQSTARFKAFPPPTLAVRRRPRRRRLVDSHA